MLATAFRTHTCGELRTSNLGETVQLIGWVHHIRNKGHMLWIDLRDHYGTTQLVMERDSAGDTLMEQALGLSREYVIQVQGKVIERFSANTQMPTGAIEVQPTTITCIAESLTPPFVIEDTTDAQEPLRMQYRYLDLRRSVMQKNLLLRDQVKRSIRNYLAEEGFVDVETPTLICATPEGARDFVVPSRLHPGQFYALPQSPQLLKQLLMLAGIDRYYQIAKCFRDEDLRADRQPEFTQVDCELSFVQQEDVVRIFERLVVKLFAEVLDVHLEPFVQMGYAEAICTYGTDKPDLRFAMPLHTLEAQYAPWGILGLQSPTSNQVAVGLRIDQGRTHSRNQQDRYKAFAQSSPQGQVRSYVLKHTPEGGVHTSAAQHMDADMALHTLEALQATAEDLVVCMLGDASVVYACMGELRSYLGQSLGLCSPKDFAPLWVVDFPLLEWNAEKQRYYAAHHPFTAPAPKDQHLEGDPAGWKAQAYDLVINGMEVGGGSIRIHSEDMQNAMFKHLGLSKEEAQARFGFFLHALRYGTPPHGGIALGLDRLCSIMAGTTSIRDVMAFPKNSAGKDLLMGAPSFLAEEQLDDLQEGGFFVQKDD